MKKFSCIVLVCLFVFGVLSGARAYSYSSNHLFKIGAGVFTGAAIGGVIGETINGVMFGTTVLAKKVFSHSGPKCPLLPFVRR